MSTSNTTQSGPSKSTDGTVKEDEKKSAEKAKQAENKQKSAKNAPSTEKNSTKAKGFLKEKRKRAKTKVAESEGDSESESGSESSDSEAEKKKPKRKSKEPKSKAKAAVESESDLDSSSDSSDSIAEKKKSKKKAQKPKSKAKKTKSKTKADSSDSISDSSDSSDSENTKTKKKEKKKKKAEKEKAARKKKDDDEMAKTNKSEELEKAVAKALESLKLIATKEASEARNDDALKQQLARQQSFIQLMLPLMQLEAISGLGTGAQALGIPAITATAAKTEGTNETTAATVAAEAEKKSEEAEDTKIERASVLEYVRLDRVYNSRNHCFQNQPSTDEKTTYDEDKYIFVIRRIFDHSNKYIGTNVVFKSKLLVEALKEIMDGVEGLSLVDDAPTVGPNMLFIFLEDLRKVYKQLKKRKIITKKNKKQAKKDSETQRKHLKLLLGYLDERYAETKKSLYPMLESGLITFDLLWALYKPNTIAWATTYNTIDQPRAFKIVSQEKKKSVTAGEYYQIEGKYFEYDGKIFGTGEVIYKIYDFKGAKQIASLDCYPIKYHKDEAGTRAELIARGKKFVSLCGVQYKSHEGLAYVKKRGMILKINIDSRIMVDPAIFRRNLPNYQISDVTPQDPDIVDESDESEDSDKSYNSEEEKPKDDTPKMKKKIVQDSSDSDKFYTVRVPVNADGMEIKSEKLKEVAPMKKIGLNDKKAPPKFKDEEYLIASPVVLGFSFAEKEFLEFTVSGVKEIAWNEGSYESLVLPDNTKTIVRGLVESHKNHPKEGIDDVIQGKGKGLVAVLHGPPGTGKTLTAEGISELLKCPLYMVSVGELGTNPRTLETELQRVLDIAHAWGAVLLLDEADVFLEQRTVQDINRNALVSIFLRLLEYFQGVLFLTTNRVATFDEAFQSRIHIALKYGALEPKARRDIFKMFIERVRVAEGRTKMTITENDLDTLSRIDLNGRQIKNTVRTAQALALNKGETLTMKHIQRVLDVAKAFGTDLGQLDEHNSMYG